jgi:hypothetical protein
MTELFRWLRNQWDRTAAALIVVVGLLALLLGWLGISHSTLATEQIPYLASGGLVGLFALGLGATLWLSADLRDEWRKLDDLHRTVRERPVCSGHAPPETVDTAVNLEPAPAATGGSRQP